MTAAYFPLDVRRNAPEAMRLQWFTLDGSGNEVPRDLNDCDLLLKLRLYPGASGDPALSIGTAVGGITIEDPAQGLVEIDWPKVGTALSALPSNPETGDPNRPLLDRYAYDLLLIDGDRQLQALLEGPVNISYGVTRA